MKPIKQKTLAVAIAGSKMAITPIKLLKRVWIAPARGVNKSTCKILLNNPSKIKTFMVLSAMYNNSAYSPV